MATAKVTKYYSSIKWVDVEYVVLDSTGELEKNKLHLDQKFYRKDCTPVSFAHHLTQHKRLKKKNGVHCGWTMYREGVADIGEDVYELMDIDDATPETQP